jgi:hypothetical protein
MRVVDTVAAYWTLVVAWVRLLLGLGTVRGRHSVVAWPTIDPDFGADPQFAATLHVMNEDPVVRPEVRA